MMNKKIGLMGGTFNPIHNGHLIMAEYAYDTLNLDKIIFIPAGIPGHKEFSEVLPDNYRLEMVKLATRSNDHFETSTIDMDRAGKTYTFDTINLLKNSYEDTDFYFIIGADSVLDLQNWRRAEDLMKICHFIATNRAAYNEKKVKEHISFLREKYCAKIDYITIPNIEISSSMIRERVKNKKSIKYMIPDSVESYIYEHSLY